MIELWMFYIIISIIALVIEIFAPSLFCINFAFAGIFTSILSIFWGDFQSTLIVFVIASLVSLIFIKPLLAKLLKKEKHSTFDSQYIGKVVKTIEPITQTEGAVSIYDERWEARTKDCSEEIPAGCDVKIVSNDSLILYVEKV